MIKRALVFLVVLALLPAGSLAEVREYPTGGKMPSRYDMRDEGIVTPVKLQYPWGTCWAFGSIAAAETSILSAMGRTWEEYPLDLSELHAAWFTKRPVREIDDPNQAGEGPLPEEYEDPQVGEQLLLNSGMPYMVAALFASGAGPAAESSVPYSGREATPEAWIITREPEAWVRNYMRFNIEKTKPVPGAEFLPAALRPPAPMTEEELRAEAEKALKKKQDEIAAGCYFQWYMGDDWQLPETDGNGHSLRMQRENWLLKDENRLPPPLILSDPEDRASVRVPNEAGMNAMKQEMLNGHAVAVTYYAEAYSPAGGNSNLYTNYETWAQYTYEPARTNHVVCIVGWDDDYPAENFTHEVYAADENGAAVPDAERTRKTTPPGNGAWLIKNSRGSETDVVPGGMKAPDGTAWPEHSGSYGILNEAGQHTGYNWISYYDQSLTGPVTMTFTDDGREARTGILQYDYLISSPVTPYAEESSAPLSAANVFTADRDMKLTGVSARTFHGESRVIFTVVKLGEDAQNPEDGEQLVRFAEVFPYPGYHRTDLPEPVALKKGDRFSVIAEISRTGPDGKRTWLIAASSYSGELVRTVVHPGESFVKEEGAWQDWTSADKDLNNEDDVVDNFSIKAFYRE